MWYLKGWLGNLYMAYGIWIGELGEWKCWKDRGEGMRGKGWRKNLERDEEEHEG